MQTMDAALAGAHPRRQDHPAPGRVALLDARGAAPPARLRLACRRPDRMATYVFKAMDLTGAKATGEVEADTKQVVADQLKARGLIVLDIKAKHGSKEISLDFLQADQADRPDDPHPSARDDDQLGHDDPARALRARGADREQAAGRDHRRRPQGRRGRPPAQRRARAPPQGLLAALRGHDPRRRDRRRARGVAAAGRRPAREGGLAAPADQVGHGLPGGHHDLRADRPRRASSPSSCPVFVGVFKQFGGDLPTITKFTVGALQRHQGPVVGLHRRLASAPSGAFASSAAATGGARSGTPSACACR